MTRLFQIFYSKFPFVFLGFFYRQFVLWRASMRLRVFENISEVIAHAHPSMQRRLTSGRDLRCQLRIRMPSIEQCFLLSSGVCMTILFKE